MGTIRAKERRVPHLSLVEPHCDVCLRWIGGKASESAHFWVRGIHPELRAFY